MDAPDTVRAGARRIAGRLRRARSRRQAGAQPESPAARARREEVLAPVRTGDRLVESPVFVLSSVRSGSTLLRVILNSHSQVCAPHELHLGDIKVQLPTRNAQVGMTALELGPVGLENLLRDRVLHLILRRSGKSVIVDKTPQNTFDWDGLRTAWPQARYIFLLRHPARVAESMVSAWPKTAAAKHYAKVAEYAASLAAARTSLDGCEVRYEELVADPTGVTQRLCAWLGVPWEESMLRYREQDHGKFRGHLGDWSPTIRSGVIRPPQPDPDPAAIPDELREACRLLGYL